MQVTCPSCGAKLNISDNPSRGDLLPHPGRSNHDVYVDAVAPTLKLIVLGKAAGPGGEVVGPKEDK
jgi:hypothetical protein